jgi:hypothetical protein
MLDFFFYITSIYDCQVIPKFYSATYKERCKLHAETGQEQTSTENLQGSLDTRNPHCVQKELSPRRLIRSSRPTEIFQPPQQGFFSVHAQLQLLGKIVRLLGNYIVNMVRYMYTETRKTKA